VSRKLKDLGSEVKLRHGSGKVGPIITDNGNFILDCEFDKIEDEKVERVEEDINSVSGVVENGLFPKAIVDKVLVGKS